MLWFSHAENWGKTRYEVSSASIDGNLARPRLHTNGLASSVMVRHVPCARQETNSSRQSHAPNTIAPVHTPVSPFRLNELLRTSGTKATIRKKKEKTKHRLLYPSTSTLKAHPAMGREAWVYKGHSFIVPVNKKIKEHKFWNEWNFQYDPAFLSLAQKHELQPSGWYRQIPFLSIRLDLTFLNKDLADHRAYIIRLAVTERDSVGKSNGQGGEDRNVNKRELHGGLERWLRNSGFSPTSCDPPQNFSDWLRRACSPLSVARFIFFTFVS